MVFKDNNSLDLNLHEQHSSLHMLIALNLERKIKPIFCQDNSSSPLVQQLKPNHLLVCCMVRNEERRIQLSKEQHSFINFDGL